MTKLQRIKVEERFLGEGAKGFVVSGPYPLPQSLMGFNLVGEVGAEGPAFPEPLKESSAKTLFLG